MCELLALEIRDLLLGAGALHNGEQIIAAHLLATLREALSNVAKHAGASQAQVTVDLGSEIVLRVEDDVGRHVGNLFSLWRGGGRAASSDVCLADRGTECHGRVRWL